MVRWQHREYRESVRDLLAPSSFETRACGCRQISPTGCPARVARVADHFESAGSAGHARDPGRDQARGSRTHPVWPHEPDALHVLPRCGCGHGSRLGGRTEHRHPGTALRRRASVELRSLQLPRPSAALRRQRFRRDAPRPLRVGPETSRSQRDRRRTGQRAVEEEGAQGDRGGRCGLPPDDPQRRTPEPPGLVLFPYRRPLVGNEARGQCQDEQGPEENHPQGCEKGQSACPGEADRHRGWPANHRPRPPAHHQGRDRLGGRDGAGEPLLRRLQSHPSGQPAGAARPFFRSSMSLTRSLEWAASARDA